MDEELQEDHRKVRETGSDISRFNPSSFNHDTMEGFEIDSLALALCPQIVWKKPKALMDYYRGYFREQKASPIHLVLIQVSYPMIPHQPNLLPRILPHRP